MTPTEESKPSPESIEEASRILNSVCDSENERPPVIIDRGYYELENVLAKALDRYKAEIERLNKALKTSFGANMLLSDDSIEDKLIEDQAKEISTLKAQIKEKEEEIAHLTRDGAIHNEMGFLKQLESLKSKLSKAREALKYISNPEHRYQCERGMGHISCFENKALEILEQIGEEE